MKAVLILTCLFFTVLDANAICLTISENPAQVSAMCRQQITNYFRYHRGWSKDSCNGIYSYKRAAPNTVQLKYVENGCDARMILRVQEERNFCFVQALTPFPDTQSCGN